MAGEFDPTNPIETGEEQQVQELINGLKEQGLLEPAEGVNLLENSDVLQQIRGLLSSGEIVLTHEQIIKIIIYLFAKAKNYEQDHLNYVNRIRANKQLEEILEGPNLTERRQINYLVRQKEIFGDLAQGYLELLTQEQLLNLIAQISNSYKEIKDSINSEMSEDKKKEAFGKLRDLNDLRKNFLRNRTLSILQSLGQLVENEYDIDRGISYELRCMPEKLDESKLVNLEESERQILILMTITFNDTQWVESVSRGIHFGTVFAGAGAGDQLYGSEEIRYAMYDLKVTHAYENAIKFLSDNS